MNFSVFPEPFERMVPDFLKNVGRSYHQRSALPKDKAEWLRWRHGLRENFRKSLGEFPEEKCPLEPELLGVLEREGYRIERLIFQSRPDVYVTANIYMPTSPFVPPVNGRESGGLPGVLVVHGHWAQARVDPAVQERCLGLVKLGYVVLAVDAFGAGERGTNPGVSEYHGSLLGAGLWPVGTPLLGLQVYDNIRALDYLCSRPEVNASLIGCTGASGGGNQTMYITAFDERIKAGVPVCSVGTFDAYIAARNCVCETLYRGITYAEEGDLLALVAPHALMVINATQDSHVFSVGEALKSVETAKVVYRLLDVEKNIKFVAVESGHGYNQTMREAMYGWFNFWLKLAPHLSVGLGDGSPVAEPSIEPEDPVHLKCFPEGNRPAKVVPIVEFAYRRARELTAKYTLPNTQQEWLAQRQTLRNSIIEEVFGGFPEKTPLEAKLLSTEQVGMSPTHPRIFVEPPNDMGGEHLLMEKVVFTSEPGISIPAVVLRRRDGDFPQPASLFLHPEGKAATLSTPLAGELIRQGQVLMAIDLRNTGETRWTGDAMGDAKDHDSARASVWIGRPVLGQWVWDVIRALDYLASRADVDANRTPGPSPTHPQPLHPPLTSPRRGGERRRENICCVGYKETGLAALFAAALDERIAMVLTQEALYTYVAKPPFRNQPIGVMLPGILQYADLPQIAAMVAPRRACIVNGVSSDGIPVSQEVLTSAYQWTESVYRLMGVKENFQCPAGISLPCKDIPMLE